jgi:steroid delta-isomerase-like uncharacterized protein
MSSLAHATRWCDALSNDIDALCDLYHYVDHPLSEGFSSEHSAIDDNVTDTFTTREQLRAAYGPYSAAENGTYTFTATEWRGDEHHGIIHWTVQIEGASTFRDLPVPAGLTIETTGSTFQKLDADGRITYESTYWEDNRVFKQLGIAILTPHYWEQDFDMEAFLAQAAAA